MPINKKEARLEQLAQTVKDRLSNAEKLVRGSIEETCEAGKALIEARELVAHGGWGKWVKENCRVSQTQAQKYMDIARADEYGVDISSARSIEEAYGMVRKAKAQRPEPPAPEPDDYEDEMDGEEYEFESEEEMAEWGLKPPASDAAPDAVTAPPEPAAPKKPARSPRGKGAVEEPEPSEDIFLSGTVRTILRKRLEEHAREKDVLDRIVDVLSSGPDGLKEYGIYGNAHDDHERTPELLKQVQAIIESTDIRTAYRGAGKSTTKLEKLLDLMHEVAIEDGETIPIIQRRANMYKVPARSNEVALARSKS